MTYTLILGDPAYSSWSLRGWLLFEKFNIPQHTVFVDFDAGSVAEQLTGYFPAKTVPTMLTPEGAVVSESLAIAEELHSRFPDAGIWPKKAQARATARTITSEMHAGFLALREDCPMNLRCAYDNYSPNHGVKTDLRRLEVIWKNARDVSGSTGPWLCGAYSAADAFFAPIAARIAGYGLAVNDVAAAYVRAHLQDPAFRQWRARGLVQGANLSRYARDYTLADWPGPKPLAAKATQKSDAVNAACPYSGKPVNHFLNLNSRIYGFCNEFCRDKTVADPEAWPEFMKIYQF